MQAMPRREPATQHRVCALIHAWCSPAQQARLSVRMHHLARAAVDRLAPHDGECADLMTELAQPYARRIVMDLLGIPPEDEHRLHVLTHDIRVAGEAAHAATDPLLAAEFCRYVDGLVADRRAFPRHDLITLLAQARGQGQCLPAPLQRDAFALIACGGQEILSERLTAALWSLANEPAVLAPGHRQAPPWREADHPLVRLALQHLWEALLPRLRAMRPASTTARLVRFELR